MKKFKKIITSILACSLVFACCFGLVGCNDATDDETPSTTDSIYSVELAQSVYESALANSLSKNQYKATLVQSDLNSTTNLFETSGTSVTVYKENLLCANDTEWIRNNNVYDEETKTYRVCSAEQVNFMYYLKYFSDLITNATTKEFLGGTFDDGVSTINVKLTGGLGENVDYANYQIVVEDNLIIQYNVSVTRNGVMNQYTIITFSYEDVSFPRDVPDFSTYTKGSGITPLQ